MRTRLPVNPDGDGWSSSLNGSACAGDSAPLLYRDFGRRDVTEQPSRRGPTRATLRSAVIRRRLLGPRYHFRHRNWIRWLRRGAENCIREQGDRVSPDQDSCLASTTIRMPPDFITTTSRGGLALKRSRSQPPGPGCSPQCQIRMGECSFIQLRHVG